MGFTVSYSNLEQCDFDPYLDFNILVLIFLDHNFLILNFLVLLLLSYTRGLELCLKGPLLKEYNEKHAPMV